MKKSAYIGFVLLALAALIAFQELKKRSLTNQVRCQDCNVVMIVLDPLRADSLHALGNPRPTTPTLDALAKEGVLFTNTVAVSSWTLPSAMSLMTGVYPSVHKIINKELIGKTEKEGVIGANLKKASPDLATIASVFKSRGYATAGFAGGAALDKTFGFDSGFDTYVSDGNFEGLSATIPKALNFVKSHADEKLFLFLHGFDTHGQYVPPEGFDKRYISSPYRGSLTGSAEEQKALREQAVSEGRIYITPDDVTFLRALYDEKVNRADSQIARFMESYRSTVSRKTIFVITSDHGEEFYEHGRLDHGMTLYDEVLRIPLIIVIPQVPGGKRVVDQVANIDIMPTLLNLVGISPSSQLSSQMEGTDLIPLIAGGHQKRDVYPETSYRYATFQKAIRSSDWKLIYDQETRLRQFYNIARDPGEQNNLLGTVPKIEQELFEKLMTHKQ